jgi:hypothetical protein
VGWYHVSDAEVDIRARPPRLEFQDVNEVEISLVEDIAPFDSSNSRARASCARDVELPAFDRWS